jgi:hypothetical protein
MIAILAFVLSTAFPSNSRTSWMRPDAFRLTVGMSRAAAVRVLADGGWSAKPAKQRDFMYVDYSEDKAITLEFEGDRLRSIRFELYVLLDLVPKAFAEEKTFLQKTYGPPKKMKTRAIVLYDSVLPNVMMVMNNDPKGQYGKRGLGVLVVRYYDPTPRRAGGNLSPSPSP